jgi:hypothetical protein
MWKFIFYRKASICLTENVQEDRSTLPAGTSPRRECHRAVQKRRGAMLKAMTVSEKENHTDSFIEYDQQVVPGGVCD